MLSRAARELDDHQVLAFEAAPNAVGLGHLGTAGRCPLQHPDHLSIGVVGEANEGRWQARGQGLLNIQLAWGRKWNWGWGVHSWRRQLTNLASTLTPNPTVLLYKWGKG